jgi:DNA-binding LacI/PurR family transcriptional regulator
MNISDLARHLRLSTATISRALNRPEAVAPGTRQRVLQAVQRTGYQLNGIARSLRTQHTRTIGMIVSDIRNPFFSAMVKAVEDIARVNGFTVLVCNADEDGRNEEAALRLFIERHVSGVIHCSVGANPDLIRVLQNRSTPIIDLDRESGLEKVDTVILNNELGAALATQHLIDLGHRRLAMIAGPTHLSNGRTRLAGFRKTLRKARLALPKEYVEIGDFREESGRRAAKKLISLSKRPTGLVVANNEMMAGALSVIRQRRVKIPAELSLVSFDDARWAQYLEPPLTVVAQPTEKMGCCAAEILLSRLHKKNRKRFETRIFQPELIIRASTGPPATD